MKTNKTKQNTHIKPWSLFCIGQLLLGRDLPQSLPDMHSDTSWEQTDFPLPVHTGWEKLLG